MNNQTSLIATLNFNAFADPALEAYNMLYVAVKKMLDKRGLQLYSGRTYKTTAELRTRKPSGFFMSGTFVSTLSLSMVDEECRIPNKHPQAVVCKLSPPPSFKRGINLKTTEGIMPIEPIAVISGKLTLLTRIKLYFMGVRYE